MHRKETTLFSELELQVYAVIAGNDGIKAKEMAKILNTSRTEINRILVSSALMRELCYKDAEYGWHALVQQKAPYEGLYEFSGWYGTVQEFMKEAETQWLRELETGCRRIGRNLNDTRGLIHSFTDCRKTMLMLFDDIKNMSGLQVDQWEIAFELRFNLRKYIRIYADVLVITDSGVFSLEFKMKKDIQTDEVLQAAKYVPYLEVLFGKHVDIFPALVLTEAKDLFKFENIGNTDYMLPVASGDMLFNVFNEYLGFLD